MHRSHLLAAACLLLLAGAAPAGDLHLTGALRLSPRRAPHDDPGVALLQGTRALEVRRLWFGDRPSPARAPDLSGGTTFGIPPGDPGARVPVAAEFEDGSRRRLGRFRYDDALFPPGTRTLVTGGGAYCHRAADPEAWTTVASTHSRVERLRDGSFLYAWSAANASEGTLTLRWDLLLLLGRKGPFLTLGPGEVFEETLVSTERPIRHETPASVDALPGCLPDSDGEEGASWAGYAWMPRSLVPGGRAPRNLRVFSTGTGSSLVTWEPPEGPVPERYALVYRFVRSGNDGESWYLSRWEHITPPDSTEAKVGLVKRGVVSICVRALDGSTLGDPALAWAEH